MSQRTHAAPQDRTAQACEPCRKKKAKCPGERPECSYCRRLGQSCHYDEVRASKRRRTVQQENLGDTEGGALPAVALENDRVSVLENKVDKILDTLNSLIPNTILRNESSSPRGRSTEARVRDAELIESYTKAFHGQPFLLFEPEKLHSQIEQWPPYLYNVVSALVNRTDRSDKDGLDLVSQVRSEIMRECRDDSRSVDLAAAICILAYLELSLSQSDFAYLHITMAVRMCDRLLQQAPASRVFNKTLCGCVWTATYMMQTWFGENLSSISCDIGRDVRVVEGLPHTFSPLMPSESNEIRSSPSSKDSIYKEISSLLHVWTLANTMAQEVKAGKAYNLWLPNTAYERARQSLFEFEATHSPFHRLENCKFDTRSPDEISKNRQYWFAWLTQQLVYHASSLLMHHPLVHTSVKLEGYKHVPPSFRQHAIDQTLLHAKWIVRLIGKSMEKGLRSNDPFLAHFVAVTASALIFFVHTSNERIRGDATRGFEKCLGFVSSFSPKWPHIKNLERRLSSLRQTGTNQATPGPTAQSSILWDLLSFELSSQPFTPSSSSGTVQLDTNIEHLAPVAVDPSGKEGASGGLSQNQASLAATVPRDSCTLYDLEMLDSFDAALPTSTFHDLWFDVGEL